MSCSTSTWDLRRSFERSIIASSLAAPAGRRERSHFVSSFKSSNCSSRRLRSWISRLISASRAATTVLWRSTSCTASRSPYTPTSYSFMRARSSTMTSSRCANFSPSDLYFFFSSTS